MDEKTPNVEPHEGNHPVAEDAADMPNERAMTADGPEEESGPFAEVRGRLEEIVREVGREDISLDAALDLYEEAVKLGTKATELLEGQAS